MSGSEQQSVSFGDLIGGHMKEGPAVQHLVDVLGPFIAANLLGSDPRGGDHLVSVYTGATVVRDPGVICSNGLNEILRQREVN